VAVAGSVPRSGGGAGPAGGRVRSGGRGRVRLARRRGELPEPLTSDGVLGISPRYPGLRDGTPAQARGFRHLSPFRARSPAGAAPPSSRVRRPAAAGRQGFLIATLCASGRR